jgi:hypothetical protein
MIEALLGAAMGVLTIFLGRVIRGQRWMYSIGLLVLPGLYALFALGAHEQAVVVKEVLYGIPFIVAGLDFALVCVRHSAVVVGAFWLASWAIRLDAHPVVCEPGCAWVVFRMVLLG